ncbi:MAG: L-seryl-tRNA(Sec) selenium transferase [Myxococcota bacterium]|nr:L-seryl-tRNA(Sec) selenium transferase [Myxococcota bacterium]
MDEEQRSNLRSIPRVDELMAKAALADLPRDRRLLLIRTVLDALRQSLRREPTLPCPTEQALLQQILALDAAQQRRQLREVINATGVLLHTNLGRAPLSQAALDAIQQSSGYCNLELLLETGKRGGRGSAVELQLCALSGAEAALVVNNCAAAVLLALSALAAGREVLVSRGELVAIGGGFRVPDVIVQGGARLCEVGTTNRTQLSDYQRALTPQSAVLLKVHSSNFRIIGFTESVELPELVALAQAHSAHREHDRVFVIEDMGSATFLPLSPDTPSADPRPALASGVDLLCFSGDKLLGGPQAGLMLGRADVIERCRRHPLFRALRPSKLVLAALQGTLHAQAHSEGQRMLPLHRRASASMETLRRRAEALCASLSARPGWSVSVVDSEASIGGGSLPGERLPSVALAVALGEQRAHALHRRLRLGTPSVMCRIKEGALLLELRTVDPDQDASLLQALLQTDESERSTTQPQASSSELDARERSHRIDASDEAELLPRRGEP